MTLRILTLIGLITPPLVGQPILTGVAQGPVPLAAFQPYTGWKAAGDQLAEDYTLIEIRTNSVLLVNPQKKWVEMFVQGASRLTTPTDEMLQAQQAQIEIQQWGHRLNTYRLANAHKFAEALVAQLGAPLKLVFMDVKSDYLIAKFVGPTNEVSTIGGKRYKLSDAKDF